MAVAAHDQEICGDVGGIAIKADPSVKAKILSIDLRMIVFDLYQ